MTYQSTLLTAIPVVLFAVGVLAFLAGERLVAGVCFLALALAIYFRETRL
ncbi:hypothetical protein [Halobacterium yunchengense]